MRLGLLGTPSGTLAQRTTRIGVQKLEKTPSGILGKISDRSKDKFRGSISGIYRPEDNVTRKKYGRDYRNFIWTSTFNNTEVNLSDYPSAADVGFDGKTLLCGQGTYGAFPVDYEGLETKTLVQNGSFTAGSEASHKGVDYRYDYTGSGTLLNFTVYFPQINSISWSSNGRYILAMGEFFKTQTANNTVTNSRGGSIMMVWKTNTSWSYSSLSGHPNQSPYINVGVEPWYHTVLSSNLTYPLYGEDCCWNDDGTKVYRYNRTTSGSPGIYENVIIQSNLDTAYDIGYSFTFPGTLNAATLSVGQIYSFWFSDDGYYVYTYARNGYIYQYELSTAWSISTASTPTSVDISGLSIPNTSKRYARNFKDHILALAFIASPSTYKTTFYETRQSWY